MSSRTHSLPALALALTTLAVGLGGCATPASSGAGTSSAAAARTWHDPDFYAAWHDPAAIVLPPPPFTGFAVDGKTSPMLPTRARPVAIPVAVPVPGSVPVTPDSSR